MGSFVAAPVEPAGVPVDGLTILTARMPDPAEARGPSANSIFTSALTKTPKVTAI